MAKEEQRHKHHQYAANGWLQIGVRILATVAIVAVVIGFYMMLQ